MKYTTEDNIADNFMEALDDMSDEHLEALKEAFDSGPILDPRGLIKMLYNEINSQFRYRNQSLDVE
jgi:hypothetical protein